MVETVLVTGASGTVGSEVLNQLSNATTDANIRAAVHSIESIKKVIKSESVEPIQIDYNKPDTLKDALKDVDRVFLLTPFQSDMVELSSKFLKEIENTGNIKHIVKLSVMGADSEPGIIGSRLHRQVEKMIEDSEIAFTFLRPNFFMQNFVTFLSQSIKEQGAFYLPAGDGKLVLSMFVILQQSQFKPLPIITTAGMMEKHIILQDQRQFPMVMLPEFYLSKFIRKYHM